MRTLNIHMERDVKRYDSNVTLTHTVYATEFIQSRARQCKFIKGMWSMLLLLLLRLLLLFKQTRAHRVHFGSWRVLCVFVCIMCLCMFAIVCVGVFFSFGCLGNCYCRHRCRSYYMVTMHHTEQQHTLRQKANRCICF